MVRALTGMSLFPGAIRVPVPNPTEKRNRCELRVEDAQGALNTATGSICRAGSCRAGSAPTGGGLCVVEF